MSNNTSISPSSAPSGVFVSTLAAMHGGKVLQDLDDALRELTRHVSASQMKGKLSLELSLAPNGVGAGDTPLFKISENVAVKLPKKKRQEQTFFADDDMNLSRRNPRQDEMRLEVVSGSAGQSAAPALREAASS